MKTNFSILFIINIIILFSCRKESIVQDPIVNFKIGHFVDSANMFHEVSFKNQDTLYLIDSDTLLSIRVSEMNIMSLGLDSLQLENIKFTVYLDTKQDNESLSTANNTNSIGKSMGRDNHNHLEYFDCEFKIPVRFKTSTFNNYLLEVNPPDFLRISYESKYTGLSKVKKVLILKD